MENVTSKSPSAVELELKQMSAPSPTASLPRQAGGWRSIKYIIGSYLAPYFTILTVIVLKKPAFISTTSTYIAYIFN